MKVFKLVMFSALVILFSGSSSIDAAKANFDRSKPNKKVDCAKLKGEAKKKCHAIDEDENSTRAQDYNSSRSNRTVGAKAKVNNDVILRKKPGRTKLSVEKNCNDPKKPCKEKPTKKKG